MGNKPALNAKYNDPSWIGKKFNMLTIIGYEHAKQKNGKKWLWRVRCDCGTEKVMNPWYVTSGHNLSCGCFRESGGFMTNLQHGEAHTRLHNIWCSMRQRCDPNIHSNPFSYRYSERGIRVCDEWNDYVTFAAWAKANGYDDTKSIERIDNDGNYCPENCKWIERGKQARNRCTTKYVEYQGRRMSLAEASEIAGLSYKQVHARITRLGWPVEEALSVPIGQFGRGMKAIKARTKHELSLK